MKYYIEKKYCIITRQSIEEYIKTLVPPVLWWNAYDNLR